MDTRTPKFCARCGTRLVGTDHVQSYDPYTGEPVSEQRYRCPNPTVVISGKPFNTRKSVTQHPTWELEDGVWVSG